MLCYRKIISFSTIFNHQKNYFVYTVKIILRNLRLFCFFFIIFSKQNIKRKWLTINLNRWCSFRMIFSVLMVYCILETLLIIIFRVSCCCFFYEIKRFYMIHHDLHLFCFDICNTFIKNIRSKIATFHWCFWTYLISSKKWVKSSLIVSSVSLLIMISILSLLEYINCLSSS